MSTPVAELSVTDLGPPGPVLGAGGQAIVHDLPGFRLPGEPQRLVYKAYKPGMGPSRHSLERLIARRHRLDPGLRDRLDAVTVWPLAAVVDGADLRGVVLPRIPDAYFQDRWSCPAGPLRRSSGRCSTLFVARRPQRLVIGMPNADGGAAAADLPGPRGRAGPSALGRPEDHVRRPESRRTSCSASDAEPHVMLIDCDAARVRGDIGTAAEHARTGFRRPASCSAC